MKYLDIIAELGRISGIGDLTPDSDGTTALIIDGREVFLFYDPKLEAIAIGASIGELPADSAAKKILDISFLRANFQYLETLGAVISINPEYKLYGLSLPMSLIGLDMDKFADNLDIFMAALEKFSSYYKEVLELFKAKQAPDESMLYFTGLR